MCCAVSLRGAVAMKTPPEDNGKRMNIYVLVLKERSEYLNPLQGRSEYKILLLLSAKGARHYWPQLGVTSVSIHCDALRARNAWTMPVTSAATEGPSVASAFLR